MYVSIIINNYNYDRWLGEAIDSALQQDYADIEVIVVDDGSTDNSRAIIHRYGDKIRAVFQDNGGQGSTYNAGFAVSRGDIVLFLDADDRLHPHCVSEIVPYFKPCVSKVQFGLNLIDEKGQPLGRPVLTAHAEPTTIPTLLRQFLFYPSPPGSGNAYTRECVAKRMPLSAERWKINADTHLIFAAPLDGEVVDLDVSLGDYRRHVQGASAKSTEDMDNYVAKEYEKMVNARNYVAELLRLSPEDALKRNYACSPVHLKIEVAETLSCRHVNAGFSEKLRLLTESFRTARGWTPWSWPKRWALPFWVLLACILPRTLRVHFFTVSLTHSGY